MKKMDRIAFEFSKLWKYLTKDELCEYFDITTPTFNKYQTRLKLDKQDKRTLTSSKHQIEVTVNTYDNKKQKRTFKSWEHFTVWTKAQAHPIRITDKDNINIDYTRWTDEAKQYMTAIGQ